MLFFYIRHGDPIYNPDSLTPQGERQAEALSKRLALYGLDRIFVSGSNRAQLTAEPTAKLLNIEPTVLDWAKESHTWKDFALTSPELDIRTWVFQSPYWIRRFNSPEIRALGKEWYTAPEFDETRFAEGIARIRGEADALFASLGYVHNHETCTYTAEHPNHERVALFAHQGFGLAFLSTVLDIPYPQFSTHFDLGHTGMTVIDFGETDKIGSDCVVPKVLQLSNDSHIYRDGLPTKYQNLLCF